MHEKIDVLLVAFADNHGNWSMIASFSVLPIGAVQWEVFWEENLSWIFVLRYMWIAYRVLDIIFWEVHILWCCTSFALHKVKETFGGSRWKLRKLMHVRRFLAYVMSVPASTWTSSRHAICGFDTLDWNLQTRTTSWQSMQGAVTGLYWSHLSSSLHHETHHSTPVLQSWHTRIWQAWCVQWWEVLWCQMICTGRLHLKWLHVPLS